MADIGASAAVTKQYKIVSTSAVSSRHYELYPSGSETPILWANMSRRFFSAPQICLQVEAQNGPIIAAVQLKRYSYGLEYFLGNPDCTDRAMWSKAESHGFSRSAYTFSYGGQTYAWKRTHDETLGGRKMSNQCFKLVEGDQDAKGGRVLMVYVETRSVFGKMHAIADLDFYGELDRSVEIAAMIIMLGIQEKIKERRRAGARAGAVSSG